jgi:hypothetical protein
MLCDACVRLLTPCHSANRTLIPVCCRVVKGIEHFDGSWTVRLSFLKTWTLPYDDPF